MNNDFDKYIRNKRHLMEVEEPDDEIIWMGINAKLPQKKSSFKILKIAAAILILVSITIVITWMVRPPRQSTVSLASLSPELANEENSFMLVIDQKLKEIKENNIKKEDYAPFFEELEMLDKLNHEALKDLNTGPVNPRLISMLLKYYEQKIRILEQLLNEIEKNKYHESKIIEI